MEDDSKLFTKHLEKHVCSMDKRKFLSSCTITKNWCMEQIWSEKGTYLYWKREDFFYLCCIFQNLYCHKQYPELNIDFLIIGTTFNLSCNDITIECRKMLFLVWINILSKSVQIDIMTKWLQIFFWCWLSIWKRTWDKINMQYYISKKASTNDKIYHSLK